MLKRSICPIDWTPTDSTAKAYQSGPRSNVNKLETPHFSEFQNWSLTLRCSFGTCPFCIDGTPTDYTRKTHCNITARNRKLYHHVHERVNSCIATSLVVGPCCNRSVGKVDEHTKLYFSFLTRKFIRYYISSRQEYETRVDRVSLTKRNNMSCGEREQRQTLNFLPGFLL